ncbi:Rha family transcriptional regulator [Campylobacter ureolyticus]|uniref:Rha family transcriptional regulator n=1 Tax=Campylobacter ureolyticus TaxID=827 RepID=UPI0022B598C6|nr:Rha family transcriptional regulator [Campylobacter ureolyticus]MCZ6172466.1 Rha family transcriptional regulator [Campylobacter ureolyticus]
MSALVLINSVEVKFLENNENIYINSLDLGKVFEKAHRSVLRDISNLPNDEFKFSNFIKSEYLNSQNKKQPCYNLTKDGFCLLVMGFTGEKAYKFKVEFIKAFNRLIDENKALKYAYYVDKIANLEAVALSKSKYHNDQINGYKGIIAKKNKLINDNKLKIHGLERKLRTDDFEDRNIKSVKLLSRVQNDLKQSFLEIGAVMGYLYNGDEFFINQNFKKDKRW